VRRVARSGVVVDGARGLITSNFVASAQGEVVDNQFARLYVP